MPEPDAVAARPTPTSGSCPRSTRPAGRTAILPGFGNTMRDGLGVRAERGGVELAIVGGLRRRPGARRAPHEPRDRRRADRVDRPRRQPGHDGRDRRRARHRRPRSSTRPGMIVTPGGVDPHVHWLSPQVMDAALAGGLTTLRDPGLRPGLEPRLQPGGGPRGDLGGARGAPASTPALLVRGSSARPEPGRGRRCARGGGGLKIHEDVGAGPEQIRCALDIADRHDVQLAIHTDGLNEALSVADTLAAFGGRTIHAFHIEGCGGGHAPDLLALAGARARARRRRPRRRCRSASTRRPSTSRWWRPCTCSRPAAARATATALRHRVRAATMAAEGVLHDLGVIAMLSLGLAGHGPDRRGRTGARSRTPTR